MTMTGERSAHELQERGHNSRSCRTALRLSEVGAGGRLTETAARYVELNGEPSRPRRYPLELIAREIRRHHGDVWPAVRHFGVSYEHALRVRNGWRGAGVPRARRIEYAFSRNVGLRSPGLRRARA